MRSWSRAEVPRLPGRGDIPRLWDTATGRIVENRPDASADLYVCGITPYDSTHLGHAATYLSYDLLHRVWLDAGFDVRYVQNTTDVDDPLLERALQTGVDWRELAAEQTDRFRADMEALAILPPTHFVAVTERIDAIAAAVVRLLEAGIAYRVDDDIYFDSAVAAAVAPWKLGDESHLSREIMLSLSAERGGDPDRIGKRDALDPQLWRGARKGEPSWDSPLGSGRPGWHIECSVIAAEYLELPLAVNGGGADLIFPHHEFSAGHTAALTNTPLARIYSHAGLVGYRGEKMSKSLGNLVLVGALTASGTDPRAIRLALLTQRYRFDWEWTEALLKQAIERLATWTAWAAKARPGESSVLPALRAALADDLDAPAAVAAVDAAITAGVGATCGDLEAIDALLGVRL